MRRLLPLLLAAAVLAGGAVVLLGSEDETVALPPPGSLTAATTSVGTHVWIGHRRDDGSAVAGDVWVVDATAPNGALTAWCAADGRLVDPTTGDVFDPRGRSVATSTETGLTPLEHRLDRDVLTIVGRLPAYPSLPFGAAGGTEPSACLGPDAPDDALRRHPAG